MVRACIVLNDDTSQPDIDAPVCCMNVQATITPMLDGESLKPYGAAWTGHVNFQYVPIISPIENNFFWVCSWLTSNRKRFWNRVYV